MGLMSPDAAQSDRSAAGQSPELSIIAPAHNEQDNIVGLVEDVEKAMSGGEVRFEFIIIDDGSTDATAARLAECCATRPWLRTFKMLNTPPGKGNGQSAAFFAGLREARGQLIALMDADRQNDPTDLPAMIQLLRERDADMVQGDRSANRRDTIVRKFSSWVGRTFRRTLLGDTIRDTGCSLRVFKRELGLQLPLQYKGMHRFIPVYARTLGYTVIEMPVHHRPRTAGEAKYGVWNRALPGLRDLIAVRWMRRRLRPVRCESTSEN
ncbi:glycosyltransferase [Planctomycetales bacterium ZRK34]|nr:glycosyltransferase [Planctomycetales bacterium ZRK34]